MYCSSSSSGFADWVANVEGREYDRHELAAIVDRLHRRLVKIAALSDGHTGSRKSLCDKLVDAASEEFEERMNEPVESYEKGYTVSILASSVQM
jgi:hypothetical protein